MRVKHVAPLADPVGFLGIPDASRKAASFGRLSKQFHSKREFSPKDADFTVWGLLFSFFRFGSLALCCI